MICSRRNFLLKASAMGLALPSLRGRTAESEKNKFPPTRMITRGPRHHWFGYYDKWQFDPTSRFVLGMEVGFEHRSPKADDVIRIGMVDLEEGDRWIDLGKTRAWNWQQGCMLQWLPGSDRKIVWNDRERDRLVCRLLDVMTGELETIPYPIYSVSSDGKTAVTPDFGRIADVRPGYGYAGIVDAYRDRLAPSQSGIFRIDLERGASPGRTFGLHRCASQRPRAADASDRH